LNENHVGFSILFTSIYNYNCLMMYISS